MWPYPPRKIALRARGKDTPTNLHNLQHVDTSPPHACHARTLTVRLLLQSSTRDPLKAPPCCTPQPLPRHLVYNTEYLPHAIAFMFQDNVPASIFPGCWINCHYYHSYFSARVIRLRPPPRISARGSTAGSMIATQTYPAYTSGPAASSPLYARHARLQTPSHPNGAT